jgi:hypothetical protein
MSDSIARSEVTIFVFFLQGLGLKGKEQVKPLEDLSWLFYKGDSCILV